MTKKDFLKIKIPDKPGVYFFLKGRSILYIGKATSLKDRTKSYFSSDLIKTRGPLVVDMVFKADGLKWQNTDSVLEALILEAELIKKYQPYYNTKEKDDKSFNYVVITKEELPKVILVRGKDLQAKQENFHHSSHPGVPGGSHASKNFLASLDSVFGPYTNGSQLREALKIIRKIFPFLDDKSKNYFEFYKQINLVPDIKDKKLYLDNIKNLKLFFSGQKKKIFKNLEKEMKAYAGLEQFEKANEIKRQIFALQHINDIALLKNGSTGNKIFDPAPFFGRIKGNKVGPSDTKISLPVSHKIFRIEAYDVAHLSGKNMVGVMTVLENGEPNKNEYRKFKIRTQSDSNDVGALSEILERRFAHPEWAKPDLIVVDGGVAQINAAKKVLSRLNLDSVKIVSVVKDEKHRPKNILLSPRPDLKGAQGPAFIKKYEKEILLVNNEAHRFAITYHKRLRAKNFLK